MNLKQSSRPNFLLVGLTRFGHVKGLSMIILFHMNPFLAYVFILQIIFHFHFLMINEICNYTYTFLYIYEILNNISTLSENFHLQNCTYYLDIKSKFVSILICKICNCLHNIHLRHNHMIYTCY